MMEQKRAEAEAAMQKKEGLKEAEKAQEESALQARLSEAAEEASRKAEEKEDELSIARLQIERLRAQMAGDTASISPMHIWPQPFKPRQQCPLTAHHCCRVST